MTQPRRAWRWALVALKALVGVGVLAVLAWRVDLAGVRGQLEGVEPRPLLAALAVFAVGILLHAWRWRTLLRFWRIEAGLGTLVRLILGAGALNLVLPGNLGGDVYRAFGVRRQAAGLLPSAALVALERYCGFLATFVMALLAMAASDFACRQRALALAVTALFVLFLALLALVASRPAAALVAAGLQRLGLARAADAVAAGSAAIRAFVGSPRAVATVLALSAAMKLCVAATLVLLAAALDLPLRPVDVLVFLPLHTVVSALPITLNGLGLREANLVLFFTQLGLSAEQAASLAFLHLIWLYATALPGAAFLLRRPTDRRGDRAPGPTSRVS